MTGRSIRIAAVVLLVVVVSSACGDDSVAASASSGSSRVVATTSILADVVTNATCGRVAVPSLIPRGADAHEYESSPRDADRIRGAGLVVANGLGLESGLSDAIDAARSDGVAVYEVGPTMSARGSDPHAWMDPDRMATAVEALGRRLAEVGDLGMSGAEIRTCSATYAQSLRDLGREMDATMAVVPAERRKLVTNHEALGYFADRFDFEVIGAVIPSLSSLGEGNARDLETLADTMRREDVTTVFAETSRPKRVAEGLASLVGDRVEVVDLFTETLGAPDSSAGTYVGMLREDASRTAGALDPSVAGPSGAGQ